MGACLLTPAGNWALCVHKNFVEFTHSSVAVNLFSQKEGFLSWFSKLHLLWLFFYWTVIVTSSLDFLVVTLNLFKCILWPPPLWCTIFEISIIYSFESSQNSTDMICYHVVFWTNKAEEGVVFSFLLCIVLSLFWTRYILL